MRIIRKHLKRNRIHHLALIILMKMQLYQILTPQRLPSNRIRPMLQQPWQYIIDVENMAFRCANGGFEWLKGDGAEVKRESLEGAIWGF